MAHPLLDVESITISPRGYLESVGDVFAVFDDNTQDSGNVSYGVSIDDTRYFIKTAGDPGDKTSTLSHEERAAYLMNAACLARSCQHPALPPLYHVIQSPEGPMLVYAWVPGELIHSSRAKREDPESAYQRFRRLPAGKILCVLDTIYDVHDHLARLGWIAVDFYDGCLIYDFDAERLYLVDLDMYHRGSFTNTIGRMFGSSRFMAPEEFVLNARIDARSTVYTMGRTAVVLLSDGTLTCTPFRGSEALFAVITRACAEVPGARYDTTADFYAAWRRAWMPGTHSAR